MLKVHTQKLGEVTILHLRGRITISETEVLLNAVGMQFDAAVVVLDLARVSGIDAYGLGVLLELRERTRSKGIEFTLMNATRLVRQVFEITCLNKVFEFSSEVEVLLKASRDRPVTVIESFHKRVW